MAKKGRSGGNRNRKSFNKRKSYKKRQNKMESVALERIEFLFNRAFEIHSTNPELANRYVDHARKIAMAVRIRVPPIYKRYVCHGYKKLLVPGTTMRFRINNKPNYGTYLSVTCLQCENITRYILKGPARRKKDDSVKDINKKINKKL